MKTFLAILAGLALVGAARAEVAVQRDYLAGVGTLLEASWPKNRTVNIVCHGHSVPAGYFKTPRVDSLNAYPHLLHAALKAGTKLGDLMSQVNHPNRAGHDLVVAELLKWFPK